MMVLQVQKQLHQGLMKVSMFHMYNHTHFPLYYEKKIILNYMLKHLEFVRRTHKDVELLSKKEVKYL